MVQICAACGNEAICSNCNDSLPKLEIEWLEFDNKLIRVSEIDYFEKQDDFGKHFIVCNWHQGQDYKDSSEVFEGRETRDNRYNEIKVLIGIPL